MRERSIILFSGILSLMVAGIWAFPKVWYTKTGPERPLWLLEQNQIEGWSYRSNSVSQIEESALKADKTVLGDFIKDRETVRVFSAKRFSNDPNEIALFGHTPDLCWTAAGWKIQPASPDRVSVDVHGVQIPFERRVFAWKSGEKLLVYFTGLNAGQPLPYRLDHHLVLSQKLAVKSQRRAGLLEKATERDRIMYFWNVFRSRRQIVGPKQFLRIATSYQGDADDIADRRLQQMLQLWLKPGDFNQESMEWKLSGKKDLEKKVEHL